MAKLRLLYSFPLRVGRVGIGNTAWNQVHQVSQLGVDVHLACGSLDRRVEGLAGLSQTFALAGRRLPIGPLGLRRAAQLHDRRTARALASGRLRVDAVHCWPLGSEHTLATAARLGIPTFLERPNTHTGYAYDVVLEEYRRLGLEQPEDMTHTYDAKRLAVELREYELASFLLCPSQFVATTFLDRGTDPGRLVLTQYGYDPAEFSPEPALVTADEGGMILVFAGSAEPRKGLHHALDAWLASEASIGGALRICGTFSPGYRELLGSRLEHPSVEVVGFTRDMCEVYRGSHALVLPSLEEGSALVTYEAMASGATLLVSEAAGAHARHHHEALVHQVGHWEQLRDQINLLEHDRRVLGRLRAGALEASRHLTWADAAAVLLKAYRQNT